MTSRYEDKPLLRLLESYVLSTIGELSEKDASNLAAMSPKLRQLYGLDGDWYEIIAKIMDIDSELTARIISDWEINIKASRENGMPLNSQHFAENIADSNFLK